MATRGIIGRERHRGEACGTCRAQFSHGGAGRKSRLLVSCLVVSFLGHAGWHHRQLANVRDLEHKGRDDAQLTREDIQFLGLESSPYHRRGGGERKRRLIGEDASNRTTSDGNFLVDQLLLNTTKGGACGYRKCFFHSNVNDQEGYLIARGGFDYMPRLERIWKVARRLDRKHHIRHFLLEPPHLVQMPTASTLMQLNKMARRSVRDTRKNSYYYGYTEEEAYAQARRENPDTAHTVAIQRVQLAPSPNMIVRCSFFRAGRGGDFQFDDQSSPKNEFAQAVAHHYESSTADASREFMEAFTKEMKQMIRLLGQEPELWYDFQFMLDFSGAIYHIDLDRIEMKGKRKPSSKGAESCLRGILKGVREAIL